MFELFFGTFWTIVISALTWGMYGTSGDVEVNGTLVSHEEFITMLGPKVFIGIFWIIGLTFIYIGLKKVITNSLTTRYGEQCYGRVCNVYHSGTYINNRPEYKADVLVYIPSTSETKVISEIIGMNGFAYPKGAYLEIKYYKNDINIIGTLNEAYIPQSIKDKLDNSETYKTEFNNTKSQHVIVIDGIEYIRKDFIDEYLENKGILDNIDF